MAQAIDTLALFDELKSSFTEDQAHVLSKSLRQVEEARREELVQMRTNTGNKMKNPLPKPLSPGRGDQKQEPTPCFR